MSIVWNSVQLSRARHLNFWPHAAGTKYTHRIKKATLIRFIVDLAKADSFTEVRFAGCIPFASRSDRTAIITAVFRFGSATGQLIDSYEMLFREEFFSAFERKERSVI